MVRVQLCATKLATIPSKNSQNRPNLITGVHKLDGNLNIIDTY